MTWQDLKDDLDFGAAVDEVADRQPRLRDRVARRVLNLYQPCPECGGRGEGPEQLLAEGHADFVAGRFKTVRLLCPHCDGTGVEPVDGFADLWSRNGLYYYQEAAAALAAYLFGEDEA